MLYKKILRFLVLFISILTFNGCVSPKSIDQGEEAVLIYQPWFFGHGGVDKKAVSTGQIWVAFSTKVIKVNIKLTSLMNNLMT